MEEQGLQEIAVMAVMLIGLVGCLLPVVPGSPVMWLGLAVVLIIDLVVFKKYLPE